MLFLNATDALFVFPAEEEPSALSFIANSLLFFLLELFEMGEISTEVFLIGANWFKWSTAAVGATTDELVLLSYLNIWFYIG